MILENNADANKFNFERWKTSFYASVWNDYIEWNPNRIQYYLENPEKVPSNISTALKQVDDLEDSVCKHDAFNAYSKNLIDFDKEIQKVFSKYLAKDIDLLTELLNESAFELGKRFEDARSIYLAKFLKDKNPRSRKVQKDLVLHLLRDLTACKKDKSLYEELRRFMFDEFPKWKHEFEIEIDYMLFSVPPENEDYNLWARRLKNRLLNNIENDKNKHKSILGSIEPSYMKYYQ